MSVDRFDTAACACCGRSAVGLGWRPPRTDRKPIWLCNDPECISIAQRTYDMKQDEFDKVEARAAVKAAEEAGAMLEQLGVADAFSGMSWEQWLDAMRAGIAGYRGALKSELDGEAPF